MFQGTYAYAEHKLTKGILSIRFRNKMVPISPNYYHKYFLGSMVLMLPSQIGSGDVKKQEDQNFTLGPHCKDKIPQIRNKYFQNRNIGASVPISTFMCLWKMYLFLQSVCLFCWRKYVDQSWDYIDRSQTHECEIWDWGRAIPRKGIHKKDFPSSAHLFFFL